MEEAARTIYRDEILDSWKEENKNNLANMNLCAIYFTQGRGRFQNNLILAFHNRYDDGKDSAWYYTYVAFYDVDLVENNMVRVDAGKYYSPIAMWDGENQVGLGANYPVTLLESGEKGHSESGRKGQNSVG